MPIKRGEEKESIISDDDIEYTTEENLEVDIKENTIYVESSFSLDVSSLVVIAKENTYLLPGRMISQYKLSNGKTSSGRICTFDDLQINTSDIYQPIIVEDGTVGNDFFITEAKVNA